MKILKYIAIVLTALLLLFISSILSLKTVEIPFSSSETGEGVAYVDSWSGIPLNMIDYQGPADSNTPNWMNVLLNFIYWVVFVSLIFSITTRRRGENIRD